MSQEHGKPKIVPTAHASIVINQPMVRDHSTGGGHLPGDELVEGDDRIVTKKWQGYPPVGLNVVGKANAPLPEVAIPRHTGTAQYATRVWFPDLLYAKLLTSPYPRARVLRLDVSRAERMPGIAYVLTPENAPRTYPLPQELGFQGEVVAIVAADTEDLAEDAVEAIEVEYEELPFASTLEQIMAPDAADLSQGNGNLLLQQPDPDNPTYSPNATFTAEHGDVEQGFRDADVIKEFSYSFGGGVPVPMQPCGSVAKWDGDKLTFWGMGQAIYQPRAAIARDLGIDEANVRFINKWNGGTFGGARRGSEKFYPFVAHIAKMTGRPTKLMLPKDQELSHLQVKPESLTKFKVGATQDGRIIALVREIYLAAGDSTRTAIGMAGAGSASNQLMLYLSRVPHWKAIGFNYKTNTPRTGSSRSNTQQEIKWAWEHLMDEMAEAFGMDPIQYRLIHISKPGTKLFASEGWEVPREKIELENGEVAYDSYASVEVLEEGAKVIGWDTRNPVPGGNPGRFKRGIGVAMSQHHAGRVGYHEGEVGFEKQVEAGGGLGGGGASGIFEGELELNTNGEVILHFAQPDSGTNHGTSMAALVAEILGFTSLDRMRVVWGDSDLAPSSPGWHSGLTTMLSGGALCRAADQLRQDLLQRAAEALQVDVASLQIQDGAISSLADAQKRTTFTALARADGDVLRQRGRCVDAGGHGRALTRGIGACFIEVDVDTWTGDWRFLRSVYCHDSGLIINPLTAEADMDGSLVQSAQIATDALPWDREFPGTRHYSVGFLSFRLPTIMDVPEQTQIFVDSLEPRWFFGVKGVAETSIGAVPGALANAIYNACGVRIREHPITREKIMAGLKARV